VSYPPYCDTCCCLLPDGCGFLSNWNTHTTLSNFNLARSPRPLLCRVDLDTGYPVMNIIWHDARCVTFTEDSNFKTGKSPGLLYVVIKYPTFLLSADYAVALSEDLPRGCMNWIGSPSTRLRSRRCSQGLEAGGSQSCIYLFRDLNWYCLKSAHCFIKPMSEQFISTYRPAMFTCATRPTMYPDISLMSVVVNKLSFRPVSGVRWPQGNGIPLIWIRKNGEVFCIT